MSSNPITPIIDDLTDPVMRAVEAAAATPIVTSINDLATSVTNGADALVAASSDSLAGGLIDPVVGAVEAAAAAPLTPVTVALAVAAGIVLGVIVLRVLFDAMALVNRAVSAVAAAVSAKSTRRALAPTTTMNTGRTPSAPTAQTDPA